MADGEADATSSSLLRPEGALQEPLCTGASQDLHLLQRIQEGRSQRILDQPSRLFPHTPGPLRDQNSARRDDHGSPRACQDIG